MTRKRWRGYIPNLVTFTSMFLGLQSILWSAQKAFYAASIALIFAAICDLLDGMIARRLGAESEFGVEIDSLADFLSSGVAPAILMYYWALHGYVVAGVDLYLFVCLAFVLATGGRLARFNIKAEISGEKPKPQPGEPKKLNFFSGIPAPAGCLMLITIVMTHHELKLSFMKDKLFLIPYVLVVAGLMLSNIPYRSFKSFKTRTGPFLFAAWILGGLSVLAFGGPGGAILLAAMVWYVATGFIGLVTNSAEA
ncbi:MAG: phosphatidylcholine/phosphatidylserine synthase [Deltaproteobacteria bacterium]|nr:MAG: phosphatidylcholine/phosphatidylserine synthase [Deltaproteobacteria bacterium]